MKWSALFSSPEPLTHHGCRLCTSSKTNCSWTTGVGANANHAAYSSSSSSTSKKQEKKPRRKTKCHLYRFFNSGDKKSNTATKEKMSESNSWQEQQNKIKSKNIEQKRHVYLRMVVWNQTFRQSKCLEVFIIAQRQQETPQTKMLKHPHTNTKQKKKEETGERTSNNKKAQ